VVNCSFRRSVQSACKLHFFRPRCSLLQTPVEPSQAVCGQSLKRFQIVVFKNMTFKITLALFLSLHLFFIPYTRVSGQENLNIKLDKKNASCVQPNMIEIIKDGMSAIYQMKDGENLVTSVHTDTPSQISDLNRTVSHGLIFQKNFLTFHVFLAVQNSFEFEWNLDVFNVIVESLSCWQRRHQNGSKKGVIIPPSANFPGTVPVFTGRSERIRQ
jgi:hypothetical protein